MQELLEIMRLLREKCPWDRKQTSMSLSQYAIEEAYEVEDAIHTGDLLHIKEELGDLLFQVVFQAQLYAEQHAFNFDDVLQTLKEKLIRRHPHVFDENARVLDEQQVKLLWQQIKDKERATRDKRFVSRLEKIKLGASVVQAQQVQAYAAQLNFDWDDVQGAWQKFDEELAELNEAIAAQNTSDIHAEFGDCLFALINIGRKLSLDSDAALKQTIRKFRHRFAYIEQQLASKGLTPEQCDLSQLDALWNEAKVEERKNE